MTSINLGASFLASKNKKKVYDNETTKGNNKIAEYNPLILVSFILMLSLWTVDVTLNVI